MMNVPRKDQILEKSAQRAHSFYQLLYLTHKVSSRVYNPVFWSISKSI